MIIHLAGIAPVSINMKDRRNWGMRTSNYTTAEGYLLLAENYNVPINPDVWNKIWNNRTLPKIEMFSWTLMHHRLLTGENLEKRGIAGPFRCPLYAENSKTINHLFLNCPYVIYVWKEVMMNGSDGSQWTGNIQDCFINWEKCIVGELAQKKGLRACWLKLPKIICWCIWIERNQRIFQNKNQPAWKIVAKTNALLGEVVSISKIPNNKVGLTDNENNWMQSLNIHVANSIAPKKLEEWEVQLDKSQFENWLR